MSLTETIDGLPPGTRRLVLIILLAALGLLGNWAWGYVSGMGNEVKDLHERVVKVETKMEMMKP